jgi:hypothetical protein
MRLPAIHELRQLVFTTRLKEWRLIERELPEVAGAAESAQLMANARHRQMERHAQGSIEDAIKAARKATQESLDAGNITLQDAQAWRANLDRYTELIKTMTIKDFKEGLDRKEADKEKDEL